MIGASHHPMPSQSEVPPWCPRRVPGRTMRVGTALGYPRPRPVLTRIECRRALSRRSSGGLAVHGRSADLLANACVGSAATRTATFMK